MLRRSPMKRRPSAGPDFLTVQRVLSRDELRCARCGDDLVGVRSVGWSVHHRRGRDGRPDSHKAQNLVAVCGSDNQTGCHGQIHSRRHRARGEGFWLSRIAGEDPLRVPIVHAVHGRCWLRDDGTVSYEEPA
jgi:5-methylcytosine-specific restriction endonuclease McrA